MHIAQIQLYDQIHSLNFGFVFAQLRRKFIMDAWRDRKTKLNVPLQCEMVSMQNQDIKRTDKMLGLEGFSGVSP